VYLSFEYGLSLSLLNENGEVSETNRIDLRLCCVAFELRMEWF